MTARLLVVGAERRTSGGEVFLHRLVRGLAGRPGFRVDVLLPEGAEAARTLREDPECARVRVLASRRLGRLSDAGPIRYVASLVAGGREVLRTIRREGHDVVLWNGLGASAYGLLPRLLAPRRRQVAVHHNLDSSRLEAFYGRRLFAGHALVCVSRAVADAVATRWNRRRLTVIRNGVPPGPPPAAGKLAGPGPLRVLSAGRITPWKGTDVLLRALELLRERAAPAPAPVEVEIAGRPWSDAEREYEGSLRRTADRAGLAGSVRFVGHVPLAERMDRAHCLVHVPVRPEPFGLVVAEGMARGCLVVAADAGGIRELVADGETGWLVPPGDAAALARRLEWVALHRTDPAALEVSRRARRRIEEEFGVDRQVREYAELLTPRTA